MSRSERGIVNARSDARSNPSHSVRVQFRLPAHARGSLLARSVYLARCGDAPVLRGAMDFIACIGPLSQEQWALGRQHHCIEGAQMPYGKSTYAWQFANARWYSTPKASGSRGGQVWAIHHADDLA